MNNYCSCSPFTSCSNICIWVSYIAIYRHMPFAYSFSLYSFSAIFWRCSNKRMNSLFSFIRPNMNTTRRSFENFPWGASFLFFDSHSVLPLSKTFNLLYWFIEDNIFTCETQHSFVAHNHWKRNVIIVSIVILNKILILCVFHLLLSFFRSLLFQ